MVYIVVSKTTVLLSASRFQMIQMLNAYNMFRSLQPYTNLSLRSPVYQVNPRIPTTSPPDCNVNPGLINPTLFSWGGTIEEWPITIV